MAAITVYDFVGLRNAITDADSTEIYLGDNITFATGGIVVPRGKGDIFIDGGGIYTINDLVSGAALYTIHYADASGPAVKFTYQNLIWNGRNFYGMMWVPENAANGGNITLEIKNVQYTGPQPIHNRYGITRVENSTFYITQNGSPNAQQEFCEANRIYFSGTVNIDTTTSATSTMWLCSPSASLTVEENAVLTVNAPNTYIFYTDGLPHPTMTFGANSKTTLSSRNGTYYTGASSSHIASSVTLMQGASFTAKQSVRNTVPLLKVRETLTLNEGSSLSLVQPNSGTSPLIYCGARAILNFDNPKSVVLYNNGGRVFSFAAGTTTLPNTLNITAELLNMWTAATTPYEEAGGFDDIPTRAISKQSYADITATISTTSSTTSALSSNIESGDRGYPMTATNFNVLNAAVLSLGRLNILPDGLNDLSEKVSGTTEPFANLIIEQEGQTVAGNADEDGLFTLILPQKSEAGREIGLGVNWNFLTKYISLMTEGSVSITHLEKLVFKTFVAPISQSVIDRVRSDWYVEVTDTRLTEGADWRLYVQMPSPMANTQGDTLEDGVTLNEDGESVVLNPLPILVREGEWGATPPTVTQISWQEAEGFLLNIIPNFPYNSGKYASQMDWYVEY